MITVRAETPAEHSAIRRINELAFGSSCEANLVDALRECAHPHISLVALKDDQIVGHIFFSPVSIESDAAAFIAMGLAPMAVLPEYQKQGIGSALVEAGLSECRRIGHQIVVVVGHRNTTRDSGLLLLARNGLAVSSTFLMMFSWWPNCRPEH